MRRAAVVLAVAVAWVAQPVRAGAQWLEEPESSGAYEHDGFLARVTLGPSATWVSERAPIGVVDRSGSRVERTALEASGAGLAFALDFGYALSSSFAWHVRLSQCVLFDPALDGTSPHGRGDPTRTLAMLGPGLSWFGPFGLYAAAAAGVALTRTQRYDGDSSLGDAGLGVNLDLGLELWASEQWAVGGALRGYGSKTFGSTDFGGETQVARAVALLLSATYQ